MNEPSSPAEGQTSEAFPRRRVAYQVFRSGFSTWNTLFEQAAEFAGTLGPDRLVNISHSGDKGDGVVVVWYWEN